MQCYVNPRNRIKAITVIFKVPMLVHPTFIFELKLHTIKQNEFRLAGQNCPMLNRCRDLHLDRLEY